MSYTNNLNDNTSSSGPGTDQQQPLSTSAHRSRLRQAGLDNPSPPRRSRSRQDPPPAPPSAGQSALRQLASNRTAASVVANPNHGNNNIHNNINNNNNMNSSSLRSSAHVAGSALGGLVDRLESSTIGIIPHRDDNNATSNVTAQRTTSTTPTATSTKEGWTTVPTSNNSHPPSQRSLHAAAVVHDSMLVFGGYDGQQRVNDFYEYNFTTKCWREIVTVGNGMNGVNNYNGINNNNHNGARQQQQQQQHSQSNIITATGTVPTPRDRHAAVVHESTFYVFGGFDGTSRVCDLYGFDVKRLVWRLILPRVGNVMNDNNNGGGVGDAMNVDAGGGGGGGGGNGGLHAPPPHQQQQLHNNHLDADGQQQQQHPNNLQNQQLLLRQYHDPPSPRHSHAAVVHNSSMYVFGGYDGSYRSDFHEFNFTTSSWRPVFGSGRSPRARYRSTACVHDDTMILYGGHDGTRHLSDVHTFDFVNCVWGLLVIEGVPPLPRDSHVSVVYKDSMFVFGGSTGSAMNDLHELILPPSSNYAATDVVDQANNGAVAAGDGPEDGGGPSSLLPRTAKWRQIPQMSGEGIAVHRFCHVGAVYNGGFYCFGGYDGSHRLNDFVKYDLAADDLLDTDIPPPSLLADLRSFLDDEDAMSLSDITLMVEGIPVRAHKLMLMRCPYFKAMLLGNMSESKQSVVHIEIVRHPIFMVVLEYLYTDDVEIPLDIAMELFVAADLFAIPRLQSMCERRLLESMTVENAATIFHTADVHSAVSLRGKALGYVLSNFETVSKTDAFEDMARSNVELVFEILRSR